MKAGAKVGLVLSFWDFFSPECRCLLACLLGKRERGEICVEGEDSTVLVQMSWGSAMLYNGVNIANLKAVGCGGRITAP